jgi:hypothetical protein
MAKIRQNELDNMRLREEMQELQRQEAVEMQKHGIKAAQQQELINHYQAKLEDKEGTVRELKLQIAVYNQETQQLSESNEELSAELAKAEHSLKEIMVLYEQEFGRLNISKDQQQRDSLACRSSLKQKEMELELGNRTIRNNNFAIRGLKEELADLSSQFEKYKLDANLKIRDLENAIAIKNDSIERLHSQAAVLSSKLSEEREAVPDHNPQREMARTIQGLKEQLANKEEELS